MWIRLLIGICFVLLPAQAFAHLEGTALINNGYRVELGQFPLDNVQVSENVSFTTSMESLEGERIMKAKAWIRLAKGDDIVFSSADFTTDDGVIDFSLDFLTSGTHELTVRMLNSENGEEATVTFPVEVMGDGLLLTGESTEGARGRANFALLTLIIGFAGGVFAHQSFGQRSKDFLASALPVAKKEGKRK